MNSQYQNNPHEDHSNSRPKGENRESSLQQSYYEIVTGRIPGSQMVSLRIPAAEEEGKEEERTRSRGGEKKVRL